MIIFDDDGIGYKVVPMEVIDDIKADIHKLAAEEVISIKSMIAAIQIIDNHIGGDNR